MLEDVYVFYVAFYTDVKWIITCTTLKKADLIFTILQVNWNIMYTIMHANNNAQIENVNLCIASSNNANVEEE